MSDEALSRDRPIESDDADRLNRQPFVENLIRALVIDERNDLGTLVSRRSSGLVVGLTGRWGLGKSSIINLLAARLGKMSHVSVAVFNPWLFKGREELLSAFFDGRPRHRWSQEGQIHSPTA